MDGMIGWVIRPHADSIAPYELRPHVEQMDGTWREQTTSILATSQASARAMLPIGYLLLFQTHDSEWWVPWYAPSWWWPNGTKPLSMWDPPPVRSRVPFNW